MKPYPSYTIEKLRNQANCLYYQPSHPTHINNWPYVCYNTIDVWCRNKVNNNVEKKFIDGVTIKPRCLLQVLFFCSYTQSFLFKFLCCGLMKLLYACDLNMWVLTFRCGDEGLTFWKMGVGFTCSYGGQGLLLCYGAEGFTFWYVLLTYMRQATGALAMWARQSPGQYLCVCGKAKCVRDRHSLYLSFIRESSDSVI